jgi:RNA polymerase sigma-70 factor (ECF subfamily)
MVDGPEAGLGLVDAIPGLDGYYLWYSTRADLLRRLERDAEAIAAYDRALELAPSDTEREFLRGRLAALR